MTRDEETRLLRKLQEADKEELLSYMTLSKAEHHTMKRRREVPNVETGELMEEIHPIRYYFDVVAGDDEGYLQMDVLAEEKTPVGALMNVGFPTMIGLNRSPLELRILCEHILTVLADEMAAARAALTTV